MKKLLFILFAVCLAPMAYAQGACTVGSVSTGTQNSTSIGCTPVTSPVGNTVWEQGLHTAMTTHIICPAASCPAGEYFIVGHTLLTQAATLGTMTGNIHFTADYGPINDKLFSGMTLASINSASGYSTFMYIVRTTGTADITIDTTVASLTGTPTYDFFAAALRVRGSN